MLNPREQHYEMMMTLADYFTERGVIVHVMQSRTTNSCYMKLDYGAGYSIRISDHVSNKPFNYRYNLMLNLQGDKDLQLKQLQSTLPPSTHPRYYYHDGQLGQMLVRINESISLRKRLHQYDSYVDFCRNKFMNQTRFAHSFANVSVQHVRRRTNSSPLSFNPIPSLPTIPL